MSCSLLFPSKNNHREHDGNPIAVTLSSVMTSFSLKERSTHPRRFFFDRDTRIADRISRFSSLAVYSAGAA
jgi:hypothetical protein